MSVQNAMRDAWIRRLGERLPVDLNPRVRPGFGPEGCQVMSGAQRRVLGASICTGRVDRAGGGVSPKRFRLYAKAEAAIRVPNSVKEPVQDQASWQTASAPRPRHGSVHDGDGILHRALHEGGSGGQALEERRKRGRAYRG